MTLRMTGEKAFLVKLDFSASKRCVAVKQHWQVVARTKAETMLWPRLYRIRTSDGDYRMPSCSEIYFTDCTEEN